jgi:hypothetical protein
VLECEQLYSYVDAHCHGGALHRISAFHTFCSDCRYAFCVTFRNTKRSWVHRRQTSLTQAYKNLFTDKSHASIPTVSGEVA